MLLVDNFRQSKRTCVHYQGGKHEGKQEGWLYVLAMVVERPEKLVFVIDKSSHMSLPAAESGKSTFDCSLQVATATIWRRLLANRKDLFSVVYVGESQSANATVVSDGVCHIRCMDFADEDLFKVLDYRSLCVADTVKQVDILKGIDLAIKHLDETREWKRRTSKTPNETIVVLSRFDREAMKNCHVQSKRPFLVSVLKALNEKQIELLLLGPYVEELLVAEISTLSWLAKSPCTKVMKFQEVLGIVGKFIPQEHGVVARFHGPLMFADLLRFDVSCYTLTMNEVLPKLTDFSRAAESFDVPLTSCGVKRKSTYIDDEGRPMEIDPSKKGESNILLSLVCVVFHFGRDKIEIDAKAWSEKIKPKGGAFSRGIVVVGATDLAKVPRYLLPDSSSLVVLPQDHLSGPRKKPSSGVSQQHSAFVCLLKRLHIRKMALIVYYSLRANQTPSYGLMLPLVDDDHKILGMSLVALPFFCDIKANNLSILRRSATTIATGETEHQVVNNFRHLISCNTISVNDVISTPNPSFQRFCEVVVNEYSECPLMVSATPSSVEKGDSCQTAKLLKSIRKLMRVRA